MSKQDKEGSEENRPSDEELVRSHLEGDTSAFEELVRRYETTIMNMAYRLLGNRSDAGDVCQEVFVLLLRKLGSFRGEAKFSTWLSRVSLNACHDHARRLKPHYSLSSPPGEDLPEIEQRLPDDGLHSPEERLEKAEIQDVAQ